MSTMQRSATAELAPTDDDRWRAVEGRDRAWDGAFVYAVSSTGVFCRPSCPSRRPRRERVRFFGGAGEAERAGFRACRRCAPAAEAAPARAMAERARRWIEAHAEERITLAALAEAVGAGPSHLQRTFTREIGMSPREYAAACRAARVKALLRDGADVTTALYHAGYGSGSRLYEQADARLGMTPGAYRRGGEGMRIAYDVVACSLGRVLVAATERGICTVSLGDSEEALAAGLAAEYPAARVERDGAAVGSWVEAVLASLDGGPPEGTVPLDVGGTEFERRVWDALRTIPPGETRTYGEVARSIGRPTAVRAVAAACAGNPVALVVPCHRVVRANGGLGGYRWGPARKRALLDRERGEPLAQTA